MSEKEYTSLLQATRRSTPLLRRVAGVMLIASFCHRLRIWFRDHARRLAEVDCV